MVRVKIPPLDDSELLQPWTGGGENVEDEEEEEEKNKKKEFKKGSTYVPDWEPPKMEPIENIFVPRREWGAGPHIEGHTYLSKPILFVRFWKYTDTESCEDKEKCMKLVKEIQERHKARGFGDITHNFLLGGDGKIYEGRGWDYKAPTDTRYKHDKERYMDVAFIGDERNVEYDNQVYYKAAFRLLDFGRTMKIIDPNVMWTWEPNLVKN
ncbi:peptidoglycan-recognition protein LF-like isoform X2 [Macrosteles quadrilineatus]|uniref:peptidoglycan-recognition protein LF-like isoform X2 n=1 Tax=Macrosteles quadrilineatus TaxID=74068 RepID=UPI0023E30A88|nr:peptidoglycan-recognition protein LF-like isoform X2 [Macrosteles quadrilineatus]